MAAPHEKLAASLAELEALQKTGRRVFRSSELTRVHRERLVRNGFLREVMKGWLISWSPGAAPGDTTPWFASLWEFCARYCTARFGEAWHLSPEQSLLLHAEQTVLPQQIVIYTPKGTNNTVGLLFGTSLYDLRQRTCLRRRTSWNGTGCGCSHRRRRSSRCRKLFSAGIRSSRRWCLAPSAMHPIFLAVCLMAVTPRSRAGSPGHFGA
jgi:hypothetical protein